jgi:hypothetical protein
MPMIKLQSSDGEVFQVGKSFHQGGRARTDFSLAWLEAVCHLQWKWTRADSKLAGSKNVMQTVYFSTSLVLKSRVLLMFTDKVEELLGYPVQNSPSGSFLF